MHVIRTPLIVLLAASAAAFPPAAPPPHAAPADPGVLAEKIRQLEQRVARLEDARGEGLLAPGIRAVAGVWKIDGGEVISPDDPLALLQLPQHVPAEYVISMRVRRISGNDTIAIGIPVGGRQVLVALDAHAGTISGLEHLDGKFVHENEAVFRGGLFVSDKAATISVTVRKDRITCTFDDVKVVDWHGDAQRLSLPATFAVPDRAALFLATLASSYAVSEFVLSPLTIPAAALDRTDLPVARLSGLNQDGVATSVSSAESALRLARLKERWKLQLLPENVPEIGAQLTGTAWEQRSLQDILGRGTDQFIRIPLPSAENGPLEIVFQTVVHHGANAHIRTTGTTKTHLLGIAGPFLEYDGLLHAAFVSKDQKFIPDTVLRVGDRKWYTAGSRRLKPAEGGAESVELTERLFEFDDDPIKQRTGRLTLHQHICKLGEPTGEITHTPTNFALFQHSGDDSQPYQVQIGIPSGRSLTAFFYAGQDYALLEEHHPHATGIFRAEKIAPGKK